MVKKTAVAGFLVAAAVSWTASAAGSAGAAYPRRLARFDGGIGVAPVSSPVLPMLVGSGAGQIFENVARNVVRGVGSSFAIWRIGDLSADVSADGRIRAVGRGLVLGSGDRIGQSLGLQVFATLICDAQAPFVELNSADVTTGTFEGSVPLDDIGDFQIDGMLGSAAGDPIPERCNDPVLLIRAATSGTWLAAGIPRHDGINPRPAEAQPVARLPN